MDELLKRLCDASAVCGNENEVRDIIKEEAAKYCDVKVDRLGNVIAYKKGYASEKKIMLVSHMDEVGLIVDSIDDQGYIRFKAVGNIDKRVLLAKRVLIGKNKIPGVLGIKAVHLQTRAERKVPVEIQSMYIDVGAKKKDEVGAKPGDYISFATKAEEFGDNKIKAKALDGRAGVRVLLELMKKQYKNDCYFTFTVQEEIGGRGAAVASYSVEPDEAIVIDSVSANDVSGVKEKEKGTFLGKGPVLSFSDKGTLPSRKLTFALADIAEKNSIPYQRFGTVFGQNDAARVNIAKDGVATAMADIPVRYKHSPVGVCDTEDYNNTVKLVEKYLDI